MPHSLRARLSGLRYKKIISDKDYDRLCNALNNENVLDKIRADIEQVANQEKFHDEKWALGLRHAVSIIEKYRESEEISDRNLKMWEEIYAEERRRKERK